MEQPEGFIDTAKPNGYRPKKVCVILCKILEFGKISVKISLLGLALKKAKLTSADSIAITKTS